MTLKLVRKKKTTAAPTKTKRITNPERFAKEIDGQIEIASGKKIKAGRGVKKSWIEDGEAYGEKSVLIPRVGNRKLYPAAVIAVSSANGVKELMELKKDILARKLSAKVNALYAKPKPKKDPGKSKK
jgi:hypothetical protein